ncbi:MAG: glycosyltransferase [Bacteroidales bacterium]|jgi:hypothetical protein|nr:glycosyltransferase [Bacteroidales bacterium]
MNIIFILKDTGSLLCFWNKIHYLDELKRAGHSIFIFNPNQYSCIDEANEQLIALIKDNKNKYDLLVSLHEDGILYKETLVELKSTSIPTLLICFDNLQTPYMHRKIAPLFDLVWLTSFETKHIFEKWGCKCVFLPYAANPYYFKPDFSKEINTVGFIGTPYGTRINKINDLIDNDLPVTVYSDKVFTKKSGQSELLNSNKRNRKMIIKISEYELTGWRFGIGRKIIWSKAVKKFTSQPKSLSNSSLLEVYPSVPFEQMNRLYSDFALSLNITEVWDTYVLKKPVHKLHLRTFEIPMCGGLQFAPYIEELAGYFEDDKEIVFYKDKSEYSDKAKYYLQEKL